MEPYLFYLWVSAQLKIDVQISATCDIVADSFLNVILF